MPEGLAPPRSGQIAGQDAPAKAQYAYRAHPMPWDRWASSRGIPIYRGHYISDVRTLELSWWEERGCNAAFLQLTGQEGICEARVSEIPPGANTPALRMAVDELVYVAAGNGTTTVWAGSGPRKVFEWQAHSLFVLPRHTWHEFGNMQGDQPVRLLHYNYLPVAMSVVAEPEFFLGSTFEDPETLYGTDFYSSAEYRAEPADAGHQGARRLKSFWSGNFFPDLLAWDKIEANLHRGAGGRTVRIGCPGSELSCHMSEFPPLTYKKAHRHGPGRVLIVVTGEGYSILWPEGKEKVVVPWQEGSVFVPPNRWFHQHFNVGARPARYLALHSLRQFMGKGETVEDLARDQIEYPDEEAWIRQKFESELARGDIASLMPARAYEDRDWEWQPAGSGEDH